MISWHPSFFSEWESPWAACQKLAWFNGTTLFDIGQHLAGGIVERNETRKLALAFEPFNWKKAVDASTSEYAKSIASNMEEKFGLQSPFASWVDRSRLALVDVPRFCLCCLAEGYHPVFHQISALRRCPEHGTPLVTDCPQCGKLFGVGATTKVLGFSCAHCGHQLVTEPQQLCTLKVVAMRRSVVAEQVTSWFLRCIERLEDNDGCCGLMFCSGGLDAVETVQGTDARIAILAEREPFLFGNDHLTKRVPQLELVELDSTNLVNASWGALKRIERVVDAVHDELYEGLGCHRECSESLRGIIGQFGPDRSRVEWVNDVCLRAYVFQIWRMTAYRYLKSLKKEWASAHLEDKSFSLGDFRRNLLSLFHHRLRQLALGHARAKQGIAPDIWPSLDVDFSSWLSTRPTASGLGWVYHGAGKELDFYCDHGQAVDRYLEEIDALVETQYETALQTRDSHRARAAGRRAAQGVT
jgi:hypothetical protein